MPNKDLEQKLHSFRCASDEEILGKGHYYENHNVKKQKEHRKICKPSLHQKCHFSSSLLQQKFKTFDVLIFPMASKKIRTLKIDTSTTYGVLPMDTKACGGLG